MRAEFADFEIEGLDLSNVPAKEGGDFALVGAGPYIVEIVDVAQEESSTNKLMIKVEFKITEGQETEEAKTFEGQSVWSNYFPTAKAFAQGRLVQLMKACGAPLDSFKASNLYGSKIRIEVYHEKSDNYTDSDGNVKEGRVFARVSKELPFEIEAADAPPPPVTKTKAAAGKPTAPATAATKPAANGAQARRA